MDLKPKRSIAECNRILMEQGPCAVVDKVIDGVNYKVYRDLPDTIREVVLGMKKLGNHEAIVYENTRVNYYTYKRHIEHTTQLLQSQGVKKGDKVGILSRNYPEWCYVFFAATCLGAVPVSINAWLAPDALIYCIHNVECRLVFVDPERSNVLAPHLNKVKCENVLNVFTIGLNHEPSMSLRPGFIDFLAALNKTPHAPLPHVEIDADEDAVIFYTSGTTNLPKGVVSSSRGMLSAVINAKVAALRGFLRRGEDLPPPGPPPRSLLTVPLFHATGAHNFMLNCAYNGGTMVMLRKWSPEEAVSTIRREKITSCGGVPHMVMEILESDLKNDKEKTINTFFYGGTAPSQRLPAVLRESFPEAAAGHVWGLTETNTTATGVSGNDYLLRPASCGVPMPNTEIEIRDEKSGAKISKPFVPGIIWSKGPQNASRYYKNEKATRESFVNGWMNSGDIGYLDEEGFLFISDRAKDIIIRGGENLSSIAVEMAISSDARVKEVAVLPVPDESLGELVSALVVPKPEYEGKITSQEIVDLVASQLQRQFVPVLVLFRSPSNPLPRNPNGKIMKREITDLKDEWKKLHPGLKI